MMEMLPLTELWLSSLLAVGILFGYVTTNS